MKKLRIPLALLFSTVLVSGASISNGGFDAGLSGWTVANQIGSDGGFVIQSGNTSPASGTPVPVPPQGSTAAMSDAQGPGSHVLYQSFTATGPNTPTFLQFSLFVGNRAAAFAAPGTLDFATPTLNQQARVDILRSGASPFSVAAADVLLSVFRTNVGDPLVSGYNTYTFDLTSLFSANLNSTLILRFAAVDNVAPLQFGVDAVAFQAIPEPSSYVLVAVALLALVRFSRSSCMHDEQSVHALMHGNSGPPLH